MNAAQSLPSGPGGGFAVPEAEPPVCQGRLQIHQASVHLDRQGRLQKARADGTRQVGPSGTLGQLPEGVVWKADLDGHGFLGTREEFYQ